MLGKNTWERALPNSSGTQLLPHTGPYFRNALVIYLTPFFVKAHSFSSK